MDRDIAGLAQRLKIPHKIHTLQKKSNSISQKIPGESLEVEPQMYPRKMLARPSIENEFFGKSIENELKVQKKKKKN